MNGPADARRVRRVAAACRPLHARGEPRADDQYHKEVATKPVRAGLDSPKLLDFGIAKLLDPAASDQTRTQVRPFTPDYASPEQVRGEPITTASDVYSLGVLLYELLSGRRAYPIPSVRPAEIERAASSCAAKSSRQAR